VFSSHPKRERDREANLNYFASTYDRGRRRLSHRKTKLNQVGSPPTTSGMETEWDDSGRKRRDGEKKKICTANEKRNKRKSKKEQKDEQVNGPGRKKAGKEVPRPHAEC